MRVNNLKIFNDKEQALKIALSLIQYLKDNNSNDNSVKSDLFILVSNMMFLTNRLQECLIFMQHAQDCLQDVGWDQAMATVKKDKINYAKAKVHFQMFNHKSAMQLVEQATQGNDRLCMTYKKEWFVLKVELLIELNDFE